MSNTRAIDSSHQEKNSAQAGFSLGTADKALLLCRQKLRPALLTQQNCDEAARYWERNVGDLCSQVPVSRYAED